MFPFYSIWYSVLKLVDVQKLLYGMRLIRKVDNAVFTSFSCCNSYINQGNADEKSCIVPAPIPVSVKPPMPVPLLVPIVLRLVALPAPVLSHVPVCHHSLFFASDNFYFSFNAYNTDTLSARLADFWVFLHYWYSYGLRKRNDTDDFLSVE
jgi:hypothetical protein